MVDKPWRRVLITHAHHRELAEQVQKLLEYSGFAPVIADDHGELTGVGAAVAFDERRIIVLAHDQVVLPDALRGVDVVRYAGETLDSSATLAFLAAINRVNSRPLESDG